jgi:hypothetical protein
MLCSKEIQANPLFSQLEVQLKSKNPIRENRESIYQRYTHFENPDRFQALVVSI